VGWGKEGAVEGVVLEIEAVFRRGIYVYILVANRIASAWEKEQAEEYHSWE
jgi:dethiobiotin synthetase